ncbi:unnamed protein product, partial [Leptidea sinapis]
FYDFSIDEPLARNLCIPHYRSPFSISTISISPQDKYRWIAKVIHSRTELFPYACTASCIDKEIFITAGRCVVELIVQYTSIYYNQQQLPAKAFVLPTNESKHGIDDIGFIIVHKEFKGTWYTIGLYDEERPDDRFRWFVTMNFTETYKVIGYASESFLKELRNATTEYFLAELPIQFDVNLCKSTYSMVGFRVPCFHACNLFEFLDEDPKCEKTLAVEGAAVINVDTNKLFGVATWGASYKLDFLPIGFSVANSENFFSDLECAKKIKNDVNENVSKGFYQKLCDEK